MMRRKLTVIILALCMVMASGCGKKADAGAAGNGGAPGDATQGAEASGDTDADAPDGSADTGMSDADGAEAAGNTDADEPDGDGAGAGGVDADGSASDTDGDSAAVMKLRIVDGAETGNLVLAGDGAGEVYTLSVGDDDVEIYVDGMLSAPSMLEDGMMVEIRYTGGIDEVFPAQIGSGSIESITASGRGTSQNPLGGYYDLCGLYLQVLEDLWNVDSGLNEGAAYVSVDLSGAPGELTEGEKAAVAWIFACAHDAEMLTLTYEELVQQGYLSEYGESEDDGPKYYEWQDGVLFTITPAESDGAEVYSLSVLQFDAEKWRSPLGAYFFVDCKAVWSESGSWKNYSVGAEEIS
ncbi:MAG: hypothetical protein NC409_13550 [Clostridium sp.]|nr:hypothetical protein [Clostridium sp.]